MKRELVCVAVLCALTVLCQVQSAPNVNAGQLVNRLKELLRQRHAHSSKKQTQQGQSVVDLENDGHQRVGVHSEQNARAHTQRGPGLTQDQKNRAVEYHNKLRRQEGSSNMETLRWSDSLAEMAQEWADRCTGNHRDPNTYNAEQKYGFENIGECIWAWSNPGDYSIPEKPIQDWYDEKKWYVYETQQCNGPVCGHYTTVTSAKTTHIGCGYAHCGYLYYSGFGGEYMVCNYGPWGGDEKPFKKGKECTECDGGQFFCTEKLCDSSCNSAGGGGRCECKAQCKCGSQTSDCKCQCQKGFTGITCAEICEDKDPQCGANPGWWPSWCWDKSVFGGMMYDEVNEKCPKMCGHCEAGNEPCRSSRGFEHDENLNDAELEFLIGALGRNK